MDRHRGGGRRGWQLWQWWGGSAVEQEAPPPRPSSSSSSSSSLLLSLSMTLRAPLLSSGGTKRILAMKYLMPSRVMPSHPEEKRWRLGVNGLVGRPGPGGVRAQVLRRRRRQMRKWREGQATEGGGNHRRNGSNDGN